jgi:hypothetical protein
MLRLRHDDRFALIVAALSMAERKNIAGGRSIAEEGERRE